MSDKILCVLAGYDAESSEKLSALQQKLYDSGFSGVQTKDLLMHITMGVYKPDKEAELKELVKKAASASAPITVSFSHLGIFGGSKVLFVAPDINVSLLNLHSYFGEAEAWTPHTTLLADTPEAIYKATPIAAEYFQEFRGRIKTLGLYEFWPTRHILTCSLGDN